MADDDDFPDIIKLPVPGSLEDLKPIEDELNNNENNEEEEEEEENNNNDEDDKDAEGDELSIDEIDNDKEF